MPAKGAVPLTSYHLTTVSLATMLLAAVPSVSLRTEPPNRTADQETEASSVVVVGDCAPTFGATELLHGPSDASIRWEDLRGRVVVLEFWATWCGPCVAAIPHLNDLVEELKGEPITFVSVTTESPSVVSRFLDSTPVNTWVARDADGSLMQRYGVGSIPRTVVVGPDRRIERITLPESLSAESLRDLARGRVPSWPESGPSSPAVAEVIERRRPPASSWFIDEGRSAWADETVAGVIVERSDADYLAPPYHDHASGWLMGDGYSLDELIRWAWNVSPENYRSGLPSSEDRFRFAVMHHEKGTGAAVLRAVLATAFSFEATWVEEERRAIVLNLAETVPDSPNLLPTRKLRQGHSFQFGESLSWLEAGGLDAATLAVILGLCVNSVLAGEGRLPIVDETDLRGVFDVDRVEWRTRDEESLRLAFGRCGLTWDVLERPVRTLSVVPSK